MSSKVFRIAFIVLGIIVLLLGGVGLVIYYNQDKLFDKLKALANEKIDGRLEIRDFRFTPFQDGLGLTFSLMGVKLDDKHYSQHQTHLIDAGMISISLKTSALLRGQAQISSLRLSNGKLNIFRRKDGFTNLSVFSSPNKDSSGTDTTAGTQMLEALKEVVLKDFQTQYVDSLQEKSFAVDFHQFNNKVDFKNNLWSVTSKGNAFFKGLVFNSDKGGFLTNQEIELNLSSAYHLKEKTLRVNPSEIITTDKDRIGLSGLFDFRENARTQQLDFTTKEIRLSNAMKLLTRHLIEVLGKIKIDPVVTAEVHVKGLLGERIPKVDILFDARAFQYKLRVGMLRELSTQGIFTNHADDKLPNGDDNTRIVGNNVRGLFESIPIQGKLTINSLENALADVECTLNADPASLNDLLDPERYKVRKGRAEMKINYKGDIRKMFDPATNKINGLLYGSVSLQDLAITYLPHKVTIEQIRGDVAFTGEEVRIPNIQIFDGMNHLYINGNMTGLLPYLYTGNAPLKANVNIKIPDWELNWLKVLLNIDRSRPTNNANSKFTLSTLLDKAINNIEIEASLDAGRFRYNRLTATNLKGKMTLNSDRIRLHSFSMNAFGGAFHIEGDINQLRSNGPIRLNVNARLNNTNVKSVFSSFNNFGQYTITDRNLKGTLSSNFKFNAELKNDASLVDNSVRGVLSVNLREAEIIDFDPFLKMKKLLFKKRQLEHVQFAPIVHDFVINGKEIEVKKMQIESNVLTLFLDGTYSLGDKTDLNIQIPLSNLRKRDSTYEFKDHDPDIGSNINLRAIDENGKVNIKLVMKKKDRKVPFRAFR